MSLNTDELIANVRGLQSLALEDLRLVWRAHLGEPPALRSADLLRRNLAWRLQAQAFGGLDRETLQAIGAQRIRAVGPTLEPGARLAREWQGKRHEVEVLEGGVRYDGRTFESLSSVAREITGVRWNGPRFFGLREVAGTKSP